MNAPKITYSTVYNPGQVDPLTTTAFEACLRELRENAPIVCHNRVHGSKNETGQTQHREDPCDLSRTASITSVATPELVEQAVINGRRAARHWAGSSLETRCQTMMTAASRFTARRVELAALLSFEIGKTRADSLAEVDECAAILELFVDQMVSGNGFDVEMHAPAPHSRALVSYRPYGLFGVIAPFNFPLALATGMAAGALITGNAVLFKPSALTPACGNAFVDIFDGLLPDGTLQLVHGDSDIGQLVASSEIDGLAFTGSAAVGLGLAKTLISPPYARPLIAEMGGKNPAIVTASVDDVAAAARATARSAFGMTGQKCVSCSRAIVVDDVYDDFVDALRDVVSGLTVDDPMNPSAFTGPLIRDSAQQRFVNAVQSARHDGRMVIGGETHGPGWYADLTVVDGLPRNHPLTRDELFAPLLTVTRVPNFEAAIAEANDVVYGLSAGIFTADEHEQQAFLDNIEAGIVFVNNPGGATTGVWPGSQTMAGWKASGTTGKGGFGPNYLPLYLREQSRTIYRNLT